MSRWIFLLLLSGLLLAGRPGRAQLPPSAPYAAPLLDSLRQLGRWPEATQVRLLRRRASVESGPLVEPWRWPRRLAYLPQRLLLSFLADYYFLLEQPSVALLRAQEGRQLTIAQHDSAGRSTMAALVSYGYTCVGQAGQGRDYAHEAIAFASGPLRLNKLLRGYNMLSLAASALHDQALELYCAQQVVVISRRDHSPDNVAIGLQNLLAISVRQGRYDLAARYLDSARTANHVLPPALRADMPLLEAAVALHTGQPRRARHLLLATLRAQRQAHDTVHELGLLPTLVQTLTQLGELRAALTYQQRLAKLTNADAQATIARQAQELQSIYRAQAREREHAQERRQAATLQAQARQREREARRRNWGLGAGMLLAAGALLYTSRRRRLARARREENLRTRIAADLHDEVGTLLTRVSLQAELLREQPTPDDLDRLLDNSRAAARTMRDIVWGIDAQADTLEALLDRMRDFLYQLSTPAGLATELHALGLPEHQALPAECRQHLYLIFKEAVTNALRHAPAATQLVVTLARPAGQLELTVENDGPAAVRATHSGMGLRSMSQRAQALGGQLRAGPLPGGGFRVHVAVPGC